MNDKYYKKYLKYKNKYLKLMNKQFGAGRVVRRPNNPSPPKKKTLSVCQDKFPRRTIQIF